MIAREKPLNVLRQRSADALGFALSTSVNPLLNRASGVREAADNLRKASV